MDLIEHAKQVRENAYAPYSKYKVGAAVRGRSGTIYCGCNVENAAYPEGTCAEAGAVAAMIAAGETEIVEVAIVADSAEPVPPCGGCRQKLAEFADAEVSVTLVALNGAQAVTTIGELLPGAFSSKHLDR